MKKITSHKGFTLIELLVVVAIIGLLAATILASLGQARGKAKLARAQSELSSMRAAAELAADEDGYPTTLFSNDASGMKNLYESVTNAAGTGNHSGPQLVNANSWAFSATIGGVTSCADSSGFSGLGTATDVSGTYKCQ